MHFRGDIPCRPNKKSGYICDNCPEYKKISASILIIKLGAVGDVIRTTPLLRKIREAQPGSYITWLTYTPEILSSGWVNRILNVNPENLEFIKQIEFDWIINLDKDPVAIALMNQIKSNKKSGFTIDKYGHAKPVSTEAENHKWLTGLFDEVSKKNNQHYVEEIFNIAGYKFSDEEYILDVEVSREWNINKKKKVAGLNTGCGGRWTSRLWPVDYWTTLAKELIGQGYEVVLLGGAQEDEKNRHIQKLSGAKYFGHFPLKEFISLMDQCDVIVTAVTMAMHVAVALRKKLILFNNIFNKNEFYLYERGEILEPDFDCDCYFTPECPNNCMQYLKPEKVLKAVLAE